MLISRRQMLLEREKYYEEIYWKRFFLDFPLMWQNLKVNRTFLEGSVSTEFLSTLHGLVYTLSGSIVWQFTQVCIEYLRVARFRDVTQSIVEFLSIFEFARDRARARGHQQPAHRWPGWLLEVDLGVTCRVGHHSAPQKHPFDRWNHRGGILCLG